MAAQSYVRCSRCGTANPLSVSACLDCGRPLPAADAGPADRAGVAADQQGGPNGGGGLHRRGRSPAIFVALVVLLALALAGGLLATGRVGDLGPCDGPSAASPCTRIPFAGNSYTYVNDLPGMFVSLAASGGHRVRVGMAAEGGLTVADHVGSAVTGAKLDSSPWDIVVLQEQSQIPSVAQTRSATMEPAARTLVQRVETRGATAVLFLTPAHRDGWPENGMASYASMQDAITTGYMKASADLGVPVMPVGVAWSSARQLAPEVALWDADGSHPSAAGTYLAACVFYAAMFRQSPAGLADLAGMSPDIARKLQSAAASTVLVDPGQWGLR